MSVFFKAFSITVVAVAMSDASSIVEFVVKFLL